MNYALLIESVWIVHYVLLTYELHITYRKFISYCNIGSYVFIFLKLYCFTVLDPRNKHTVCSVLFCLYYDMLLISGDYWPIFFSVTSEIQGQQYVSTCKVTLKDMGKIEEPHTTAKQAIHKPCLVQDCSNSIANALELLQSCTKPLVYTLWYLLDILT